MFGGKKVLCIIPARGGSKRLPRKNILDFSGKPLIAWTVEQALSLEAIDRVVVSTDDAEIADCAREYRADVPFIRPPELASDSAGTIDVLLHVVEKLEKNESCFFDILLLLPVTAPLRRSEDIEKCLSMLLENGADNVFSVVKTTQNPYFNMVEIDPGNKVVLAKAGKFDSMQSAPSVFVINGSVYAWRVEALKRDKKLITENTGVYIMPKERSVDIDDMMDFSLAESIFRKEIK
jgi:CMP-N,N'-diacetyllegionaminic acid synthase